MQPYRVTRFDDGRLDHLPPIFFNRLMETSESNPKSQEVEKTLVVQNKMGIHARPAAMIVKTANKFASEIFFEKDEELVNGKSIMGLMMLAAGHGSKLRVISTGNDADKLMQEVEALFSRKFDES